MYREASDSLRQAGAEKLERLLVLEQWLAFEKAENDEANLNYVKVKKSVCFLLLQEFQSQMPRRVKKRRQLTTDTGADAGWEEYWDYIFPEDEVTP